MKKLSKLVSVLLAAVMLIAMVGPIKEAQAAGKPTFKVVTSSSSVKPGETITAELWLEPNSNLTTLIVDFKFDVDTYEFVKGKKGDLCLEASAASVSDKDVDIAEGAVTIMLDFDDEAYNERGLIYTMTLKVKEDAAGVGELGADFQQGILVGSDGEEITIKEPGDAEVIVEDEDGNKNDGNIKIDIELESLVLNKKAFTMNKGEEETLTAIGTPEKALVGKTVKWTSSDKNVVTVDEIGKVTAVGKGTATVTAKVDDKTASVDITVKVPLASIELNKASVELLKNQSEKLAVSYKPDDNTATDTEKKVTWTSSDESVAKVAADGTVTGLKAGQATITATVGTLEPVSCVVTVKEIPLQSISLSQSEITLERGTTIENNVSVIYNPTNTTDDTTVVWSSADSSIVEVKNGNLVAKAIGTTTLTATVGDKTAECRVTVIAPIKGISLDKAELTLYKNPTDTKTNTATLSVTLDPADTTDNTAVTWISSNPKVAAVENGVVTAVGVGEAEITAQVGTHKAICKVTVPRVALEYVTVTPKKAELQKGESIQASVFWGPTDTTDDTTIFWKSSDENIATVDEKGLITAGQTGGTATITVSVGEKTAICEIKVLSPLQEITLSKDAIEVAKGTQSEQLVVSYIPADTTDVRDVIWTSSDESVATVKDGIVTAVGVGTATITATVGDKTAVCEVTVPEVPLEGIAIDEETPTELTVGESAELIVNYVPGNTTDTPELVYSSSDEKVLKIDEDGMMTALAEGEATITVETADGKYKQTYTITVKAKPVVEPEKPGENTDNQGGANAGNHTGNQSGNHTTSNTTNNGAPKTGDTANVAALILAALVSLAMVMGIIVTRRKRCK